MSDLEPIDQEYWRRAKVLADKLNRAVDLTRELFTEWERDDRASPEGRRIASQALAGLGEG